MGSLAMVPCCSHCWHSSCAVLARCYLPSYYLGNGVKRKSWRGSLCWLFYFSLVIKLLYYQAPDWVFVVVYTGFGAKVVLSWAWVRPDSFK
jgi:hypothetical protein